MWVLDIPSTDDMLSVDVLTRYSKEIYISSRGTTDLLFQIEDGMEGTEHFLLQCYRNQRRDLLNTVNKDFYLHIISQSQPKALNKMGKF